MLVVIMNWWGLTYHVPQNHASPELWFAMYEALSHPITVDIPSTRVHIEGLYNVEASGCLI